MQTDAELRSITHPLISSLHIRKYFSAHNKEENVLVIETRFPNTDENDYDTIDSCLMDLLADLENLKNEAESQVGKFDRIDIRVH